MSNKRMNLAKAMKRVSKRAYTKKTGDAIQEAIGLRKTTKGSQLLASFNRRQKRLKYRHLMDLNMDRWQQEQARQLFQLGSDAGDPTIGSGFYNRAIERTNTGLANRKAERAELQNRFDPFMLQALRARGLV